MSTDMSACRNDPQNPCCSQYQIHRFFPVGSYVQPTLTENWVSAFLEYAGKNPAEFVFIKSLIVTAGISLFMLAWGFLGRELGIMPTEEEKQEKIQSRDNGSIDDMNVNYRVISIERDLMESLAKYEGEQRGFTCCMTKDKSMKCIPKTHENKFKPNIEILECLFDGYDVELNSNSVEDIRDMNIPK